MKEQSSTDNIHCSCVGDEKERKRQEEDDAYDGWEASDWRGMVVARTSLQLSHCYLEILS